METFPKPGTLSLWKPDLTSDQDLTVTSCLSVRALNLKCSQYKMEMKLTPSTGVTVVMCNLRNCGAQVWAFQQVHTNLCCPLLAMCALKITSGTEYLSL